MAMTEGPKAAARPDAATDARIRVALGLFYDLAMGHIDPDAARRTLDDWRAEIRTVTPGPEVTEAADTAQLAADVALSVSVNDPVSLLPINLYDGRRISAGPVSGDVFGEGDPFHGTALTIELRSEDELDNIAAILGAPIDTVLQ
jgi:hypothetical protein